MVARTAAKRTFARSDLVWVGTHLFVSVQAAIKFYSWYGIDEHDVREKIAASEILIGRPKLRDGLRLTKVEGRWFYCMD